jgi:hypothetical protein
MRCEFNFYEKEPSHIRITTPTKNKNKNKQKYLNSHPRGEKRKEPRTAHMRMNPKHANDKKKKKLASILVFQIANDRFFFNNFSS